MNDDLSKKVVLLTGVGGGIGNTFLKYLVGRPKALITSSRTLEKKILGEYQESKNFKHYSYDLTKESNVIKLINEIREKYNQLDVLVNTIGGSIYTRKLEDFTLVEFNRVLRVNLVSAFLLTREAIRLMKNNSNGGNIVHIVSTSAKVISNKKGPYGIAKAGLARLIHYAAAESAEYDIKVNGISPTYTFTLRHEEEIKTKINQSEQTKDEIINHIFQSQLLKKPLYPKDIIPVLKLLINTEVITGQIINCSMGEVISY